jgi:hypothetical protein
MDEAILHTLSEETGGRFKLTALVQKRLVQLMIDRNDVILKNSGGRPIRLVVEQVAAGKVQLALPDGTLLPEREVLPEETDEEADESEDEDAEA